MKNLIYYSPTEKNLYRLKNDSKFECYNQSYFESDRLGDFILIVQEQHELILKELQWMNKRILQNTLKSDIQQNELRHIHYHQENLLNEIVSAQQNFPNQLQQAQEELRFSLLSNQIKMKNEIQNELFDTQNKISGNLTKNEQYYRQLLENINQLKDLLENTDPYSFFRFGDRIILTDITGNSISGVFIQSKENEIIWVNNKTMNVSITNKKGITISKA